MIAAYLRNVFPRSLVFGLVGMLCMHARAVIAEEPGARDEIKVKQICEAIDKAIAERDVDAFAKLFDSQKFLDRVFEGLPNDPAIRKGFEQGFNSSGGLRAVTSQIIAAVEKGGSYRWVRNVKDEHEVRPLYRLLPAEGGVNYHEWHLDPKSATPILLDGYVHLTGEELSKTIRQYVAPLIKSNQSWYAKLTGEQAAATKAAELVSQATALKKQGDFAGAMEKYNSLPASYAKNKSIIIGKLLIAQQIGEQEELKVLAEMEENFPDDPAMELCQLDLLYHRMMYSEIVEASDNLFRSLQDPYTKVLKVNALAKLDRRDEAMQVVNDVVAALPDLIDPYWMRLTLCIEADQHAKTAEYLTDIGSRFGITFQDLNNVPEYARFANSEVGKAWIAKQKQP